MLRLNEDLKNGVRRSAYLLYGEESYLKREYKNRLLRTFADPDDSINVARFEGKDIDQREIIDLAETLPFLANYRVILMEDSGLFRASRKTGGGKSSAGSASGGILCDYLPEIPETTVLIFVEEDVDKRGKMFKAIRKIGGDAEFRTQDEDTLKKWILRRLGGEKKKITGEALEQFLECTGSSMENIDRELEKLISYALDRDTINAEDVKAVCSGQTVDRIFKMIDAISAGNRAQALRYYSDLLALRTAPVRILVLLQRQFQRLAEILGLAEKGCDRRTIAKRLSVPDFAVGKNLSQARKFGMKRITEILRQSCRTEEEIKTGKIDAQIGVEMLIISCME